MEMNEMLKKMGYKFNYAQLEAAFSAVANKENWKYAIDAEIEASEKEVTREAVIHFAGCVPAFAEIAGTTKVRVTAVGYYAAVGA